MAGIYIHIPFCKQACHYCDFHFSTSLQSKESLLKALAREAELLQHFFDGLLPQGKELDTLYFGGGTPSLLHGDEISRLLDLFREKFPVAASAEVTLEANPDDLDREKIAGLKNAGINRLSIGVQSFRDSDLRFMNRAHNASQAEASVKRAQDGGITNISIDLIYGVPGLGAEGWQDNLRHAFSLGVPHLSCYALTVEEKTALSHFIRTGRAVAPDDRHTEEHFNILVEQAAKHGFVHYEISNFAKEGYHSRHNSSYWSGEPYLGLGPSAHSFTVRTRRWNVRNNPLYIKSIDAGTLPFEEEVLTEQQRFNECVMISLRTLGGLDLAKVKSDFGEDFSNHLQQEMQSQLAGGWVVNVENKLKVTPKGKLFADRIASELFMV